jgi:hypothetical protein
MMDLCTLKCEQGPLRKILDPQKGVWNDFPKGGINELF